MVLSFALSTFAQTAEKKTNKVRSLLTEIYGGGLHVIGVLQQNHFEI